MGNKDLIKQYVDSGLKLPQHQVESLTPNQFKTYIRKRFITAFEQFDYRIEEYEYKLMPEELKPKFLEKTLNAIYDRKYEMRVSMLLGGMLAGTLFKWEYDELGYYFGEKKQKEYLDWRLTVFTLLENWEFIELDNENKLKYIEFLRTRNSYAADNYKRLMGINESIKRYKNILGYGK